MTLKQETKQMLCSHQDLTLYEINREYWSGYYSECSPPSTYTITRYSFNDSQIEIDDYDKAIRLFMDQSSKINGSLRKTAKQAKKVVNPYFRTAGFTSRFKPAKINRGDNIKILHKGQAIALTCISISVKWKSAELRLTCLSQCRSEDVTLYIEKQFLETVDSKNKIFQFYEHIDWHQSLIDHLDELLEIQSHSQE
jgi:hypothetical protein